MPRDTAAYLWDAITATRHIRAFTAGRTWNDYQTDVQLRSAVERQFEVLGEALNQLSRADAGTAERVPDLPRLVAFRNVLIHAYATIDDVIVWDAATNRLAVLRKVLDELHGEVAQ